MGFRKEQINANLLNGKGEIQNVELNTAVLNEMVADVTPYVEFEKVHVSKLSFHVSSWANIRKAPIVIDIENIDMVIVEPLKFAGNRKLQPRQITEAELQRMIQQGILQRRGSYNLFDRIVDNLTIEISSLTVHYQSWGKFKTRRRGPWTPPEIQVTLKAIRMMSVNEFGQEGPPEEVWRHNHHRRGSVIIYKRIEMEYQCSLRPQASNESISLLSGKDHKLEIHLTLERRQKDNEFAGVQIDTLIPRLEVHITEDMVAVLAHALAGITYTVAKDRSFDDPLVPVGSDQSSPVSFSDELDIVISESNDTEDELNVSENAAVPQEGGMSSSEDEDDLPASESQIRQSASQVRESPVILMPNGIIIHDKVCLSLSVMEFSVRGIYGKESQEGFVELDAQGIVSELIWPRYTNEMGGYAQLSVAHVMLKEEYNRSLKVLLTGGVQLNLDGPIEDMFKGTPVYDRDETFPLYEDRALKSDPLVLRFKYPAQAFGLKTTIENLDEDSELFENVKVMHEVGADKFNVVADSFSWGRIILFAANEKAGGFDPRWHTGDWSDKIRRDILVDSSRYEFEKHVQPLRQIFLDENDLISSDLFNVTARLSQVSVKIPGPVQQDFRCCDIKAHFDEVMLVVSSALPRTFLSGKLGTFSGESKMEVNFPNDSSDIVYRLEALDDPSDRQRGIPAIKEVSTFRFQLTTKNFSLSTAPIIPYCNASVACQILDPLDFTMIFCFEGEFTTDRKKSPRFVMFTSVLVHRMCVNVDSEVLVTAAVTLAIHGENFQKINSVFTEIMEASMVPEFTESEVGRDTDADDKDASCFSVRGNLRGRSALMRKQVYKSIDEGDLSIALCVQTAEFLLNFWAQNVPVSGGSRIPPENPVEAVHYPLLNTCRVGSQNLEIAFEGNWNPKGRNFVLKACLEKAKIDVCDFVAIQSGIHLPLCDNESNPSTRATLVDSWTRFLVPLFAFGYNLVRKEHEGEIQEMSSFRLSECTTLDGTRLWTLSINISGDTLIRNRPEEILSLLSVTMETLLRPTFSSFFSGLVRNHHGKADSVAEFFKTIAEWSGSDLGMIPSLDTKGKSGHFETVDEVETLIENSLARIVPRDVTCLLINVKVADSLVDLVPNQFDSSRKVFCSFLENAVFRVAYQGEGNSSMGNILDVICQPGKTWREVIQDNERSFYYSFSSTQSLGSYMFSSDFIYIREHPMIPTFDFGLKHAGTGTVLAVKDDIAIENLLQWKRFVKSSVRSLASLRAPLERASLYFTSLTSNTYNSQPEDHVEAKDSGSDQNPFEYTSQKAVAGCASLKSLLSELSSSLSMATLAEEEISRKHCQDISRLRFLLFKSETQRLSALNIVANNFCGWVRFGSTRTSGRVLYPCTCWPRWAVLKNSVLVIYDSPTELGVVFSLSLKSSSIWDLSGGRSKYELKRAFAIVDSLEAAHVFTVNEDSEYRRWISELKNVTRGDRNSLVPDGSEEDRSASRVQKLGRGLSNVVKAAKAKGQSVVERRSRARSRSDDEDSIKELPEPKNEEDSFTPPEPSLHEEEQPQVAGIQNQSKRQQFRNRFAGVSQATKRGLGSALLAAKQKGMEVAENRRIRRGDTPSVSAVSDDLPPGDYEPEAGQEIGDTEMTQNETREAGRVRQGLGAVVRSVRRGNTNSAGEVDSAQGRYEGPRGQYTFGHPIKLRQTYLRNISDSRGEDIGNFSPPSQLKYIDGLWHIDVSVAHDKSSQDENVASILEPQDAPPASSASQPDVDVTFSVRIWDLKGTGDGRQDKKEKCLARHRHDFFALFVALSQSFNSDNRALLSASKTIPRRSENGAPNMVLMDQMGLSSFDTFLAAGKMLENLLHHFNSAPDESEECELMERAASVFLNSCVNCAFPPDALVALSDFLQLDANSLGPPETEFPIWWPPTARYPENSHRTTWNKIHSQVSNSRVLLDEILRWIRTSQNTVRNEKKTMGVSRDVVDTGFSVSPSIVGETVKGAMHSSLVKLMKERDEYHSKLASTEILHAHERDRRKKQNEVFSKEIARLRENNGSTQNRQATAAAMTSDEDLLALCQQLSTEIGARTDADLEVSRLKETHKLEIEAERQEKKLLQEKVEQLQLALRSASMKANALESEIDSWKEIQRNER